MEPERGSRALVTGASSGLGVDFARQLAARGLHLVLTARRQDRLEALAAELREAHGVEVDVVAADLSDPAAPGRLFDATEGAGKPVDVLVNNAGLGLHDPFLTIPRERTLAQIQLNVVSLTDLTHRFLAPMRARQRGWILNVGSLVAYMPAPSYASYCGQKAYVRSFTEAIAAENAGTGVHICCVSPGPTATEFTDAAGHDLPGWQKLFLMSSSRCVTIGLRALFGGRRNVVPGIGNTLLAWVIPLAPRRLVAWIVGLVMG